jgi:ankyrin repeat protein/ketosteroid isomerase-like protein
MLREINKVMTTQDTANIVTSWFQLIGTGDLAAVMSRFADEAVFELPLNVHNNIIPYLGIHKGQHQIFSALQARSADNEILIYECREVIANDNIAFAVVFTRARQLSTNIVYEVEDSHRLELNQQGKIVHWKVYFDPSAEIAAYSANKAQELISAVLNDDIEKLRWLLEVGADPNTKDPQTGLNVLMLAACKGTPHSVALLLEHAADVNVTDERAGSTALHKACQGGNVDVCRKLLDAGAFVDSVSSTTGHTPLMEALWFKHPNIVQHLLERGAGLQLCTHYGFSLDQHLAFQLSVNTNDPDPLLSSEQMIKDRKQSDQQKINCQILMAAVVSGNSSLVKELLAAGAHVDERYPIVNSFNDYHTPLLVACRDGHLEIAQELIRSGADVNAVELTFGAVPLHKAVYNGHVEITSLLVQQPEINLNFQGATNGYTPLHDALWHGFSDCAKVLVEAGARLDLRGHDSKLPVDIAIDLFGNDDQSIVPFLHP